MASRYWVGGGSSTNWNATGPTNWAATSGGANNQSVPTASDDVFFDANSGSGNCSWTSLGDCQSLDCTGYVGTITPVNSSGRNITGNGGVFKLSPGMTWSMVGGGTQTITFTGTAGTMLVTSFGKSVGALTVNGAGLTVQLQDAWNGAQSVGLTAGTFDANNFSVTVPQGVSSPGALTRSLLMGSGQWTIGTSAALAQWNISGSAITLVPSTSKIVFPQITVATGPSVPASWGGLTYNDVEMFGSTIDVKQFNFSGGGVFNNFAIHGPNLLINISAIGNYTVNNFTVADVGPNSNIMFGNWTLGQSTIVWSQAAGTVTFDWCVLGNFGYSGGATWQATNSYDMGGNTGISIAPPSGGGGGSHAHASLSGGML